MIGRAGRPGFDTHADAVVMVREEMKDYYKRVSFMTFLVKVLASMLLEHASSKFAITLRS
jgi:replicative superfamily II helicase